MFIQGDFVFHPYSPLLFFIFLTLQSINLQEITDTVFTLVLYFEALLLGVIVTGMPPYFAMENAENHKVTLEDNVLYTSPHSGGPQPYKRIGCCWECLF